MEKNYFRPIIPLFGISILIICLDQLTKTIIKQRIDYYDQIVVIEGFFNLRHDRNSGAAFSLMQGQRTLLIAATILAMLFIAYYYFQFRRRATNNDFSNQPRSKKKLFPENTFSKGFICIPDFIWGPMA